MTDALTYDPTSHRYYADSHEVPGVSYILRRVGLCSDRYLSREAMDRGTRVHLACELYDSGQLNGASLTYEERAYASGWQSFVAECAPQITAIEQRVVSPDRWWAGCVDRVATVHGRETIIDLKTGQAAPWHAIQLAGYAATFPRPYPHRMAVYLSPTGTYKVEHFTERADFAAWAAAVDLVWWMWNHGIKE